MSRRFPTLAIFVGAFCSLAPLAVAGTGSAATVISVVAPSVGSGIGGAGFSGSARFAGDDRHVLFLGDAPNLAANDTNGNLLDLFLRDLATGTMRLLSGTPDGLGSGNGPVIGFSVSANGRRIVFASLASDLVPSDTNGASDIFECDLDAGTTRLTSATPLGAVGAGDSTEPVVSGDGRFVMFESTAPDLVAGTDTNRVTDVFLRDLKSGTTSRLSTSPDGNAGNGTSRGVALSADGEVMAFRSESTDLVPANPGATVTDLYLIRRSSGTMARIELPPMSVPPGALPVHAQNPVLSVDGRFLAFRSEFGASIWWYDLEQGTNARVSGTLFAYGTGSEDEAGPVMTADGRTLAFETQVDASSPHKIAIWSADTGLHALDELVVTGPPAFKAPANAFGPVLSPDGTRVAFHTDSAVPAAGVTHAGESRLYIRTIATGATVTPFAGKPAACESPLPEFSVDGGSVLFQSAAALPGIDDRNRAADVFLAPVGLDRVELVSAGWAGKSRSTGNGPSTLSAGAASDDGRFVVFTSLADDLADNDHNGAADVFVGDTLDGSVRLVSVGADGQSGGTASGSPRISADGKRVAFVSSATSLAVGEATQYADVYVRDLVAGTTVRASARDKSDDGGGLGAYKPSISADGRYVAFESRSTDLIPGGTKGSFNVFLRDLAARRTIQVNKVDAGQPLVLGSMPLVSADGNSVAFINGNPVGDLFVYSVASKALSKATTFQKVTSFGMTSDGARLAFAGNLAGNTTMLGIYWRDQMAGTNDLIASVPVGTAVFSDAGISADGRRVVFASGFVADGSGDTNRASDVFVFDIAARVLTLASATDGGGVADGPSDSPVLDGTGRRVAFRSFASNLIAGETRRGSDIYIRDLETGKLSRSSRGDDGFRSGRGGSSRPILSGDGKSLAFRSGGDDLVAGDFNFTSDVFVVSTDPAVVEVTAPLLSAERDAGGGIKVAFGSRSGVVYQLQFSRTPEASGFAPVGSALQGTDGILSAVVDVPATTGFVRVVASR